MELKPPKNPKYSALVHRVNYLRELNNCINIRAVVIEGKQIIVPVLRTMGCLGLYFPQGTRLSDAFITANNLYRNAYYNEDRTKKGHFEVTREVTHRRFQTYHSEGFFIPITSLSKFIGISDLSTLKVGDRFDEVNGVTICEGPKGSVVLDYDFAEKKYDNKL